LPLIRPPYGDFFDSLESLDRAWETASALFFPAPGLAASLPSLLMWQDEFSCALAFQKDAAFLPAFYGPYAYLPLPPHPFNPGSLRTAFQYLQKVNGPGTGISRIEGVTADQAKQAEGWGYPVRPASAEYLYERAHIAGLRGDGYRAPRAAINRLRKGHSLLLRPYRDSDLSTCGNLFELWKSQRLPGMGGMGKKMLLSSQKAHFRALREGADWGMDAWVALVDGRLGAYAAGAPLDGRTYGLFLEVADLTVKGLSAYIFASVCRQLEAFDRINTGDAEGLPGLAESKEHWKPCGRQRLYAVDPPAST
jgi:hypothetical protein